MAAAKRKGSARPVTTATVRPGEDAAILQEFLDGRERFLAWEEQRVRGASCAKKDADAEMRGFDLALRLLVRIIKRRNGVGRE